MNRGHVELMRRDNLPHPNRLHELLGREPARIRSFDKWKITGRELELYDASGNAIASFEARHMK